MVHFFRGILLSAIAILMIVSAGQNIYAAAPPLRDQVDLAGTWTQGGVVPNYAMSGDNIPGSTPKKFERSIAIPAGWTNKKIYVDFEAVNYRDSTFINNALVGTSVGGWLPHSYDITSQAAAGGTYTLRVDVQGRDVVGGNWPVGYTGDVRYDGIIGEAFLRAYGPVAILDAEIITSVANKTITVNYTVKNFGTTGKTVTIGGNAYPSTGGASQVSLSTAATTFNAGEIKTIQASSPWANPNFWWPDDPKLYNLGSAVRESGTTLDSQTVRFGFRESRISGRYLTLNGVRINHRGESVSPDEKFYPGSVALMSAWIDTEKVVNANSIRFHVKPGPNAYVDLCDERGLMVEDEAALWQAPNTGTNETRNIWFPAWIKYKRNHASIVTWSSNNECYGNGYNISILTGIIQANDNSGRPIWSEDVDFTGSATACKHYPEGYHVAVNTGTMYNSSWISITRPQGVGETMTCCYGGTEFLQPDEYFWHGLYSRGMRYNNVSMIHVYTYNDWMNSHYANSGPARPVLANSFAPVALFDHDYDGFGIGPFRTNTYPSVAAGSTANRSLVLYNDEFSNEIVTVQVDVKSGSTTYASGTKTYQVVLGEHMSIPCSFQAPYVGGSTMDMVLTTSKSGVVKFMESKRFTVTGGTSGTSSATVTLGGQAVTVVGSGRNLHAGSVGAVLLVGRTLRLRGKEIAAVRLFDMQGKIVLFCASPAGAVDLSALRPGNYRAVVGHGSRVSVTGIAIPE